MSHSGRDKQERCPELLLKLTYEDDDDLLYYSEEDLKGDEALDNYIFKYKNLYKLKEKNDIIGDDGKSPLLDYLLDVDKEKKIPKGLGLVNRKHNPNEVFANNYLFGDRYAESFSKGIKQRRKLESLHLNSNRLTDYGFNEILIKAPNTLLVLDISYNSTLTMNSYKLIADYLDQSTTILQQLMIEGNQTGDKPIILLSKVLLDNRSLKYLNISRNNVTDIGASAVAKMLSKNDVLNVLFMHWNKIREVGGHNIAKALQTTPSLQIFDISFNNIGTLGKEHSVATSMGKAFKNNTSLIHVDISNCNFDGKDIEIMNQGLISNHNILGIHMLGNMGRTDTLGFLHKSDEVDYALATLYTRIKPTLERGHKHNSQAMRLHASSNCWICEGWTEIKFEFNPDKVFKDKHDPYVPIYLHISSDGFEQDLLLPDPSKPGIYTSTRMVPPGEVSYYFTKESIEYIATDQPHGDLFRTTEEYMNVPETNIIQNVIATNVPVTETVIKRMGCIPRPPPKFLGQRERLDTPWDFFKSVFRDYKADTTPILNKCFEFDWEMCKIPRIVKNGEE